VTNGDMIRAMTDEELAFRYGYQLLDCPDCPHGDFEKGCDKYECDKPDICIAAFLAWLKQEVTP